MRRGRLSILGLLLLAACGSSRPDSPPENHVCHLQDFMVPDTARSLDVYRSHIEGAVPGRNGRVAVNMLSLSAGGEFGSYGAGFLQGWGEAGPAARPAARNDIQIVTGVSTGALMSTHAFVGGMDDTLVDFYTHLSDAQVYTQRSLSLLWANSLFNASGKQKLLRDNITSELIDKVAAQPDSRALFIGLTNLDSGRFVKIDMKKLARGDKTGAFASRAQRDDCYRAVIDGATAIEVAFPPVFIDGQMYGDGGVRQHVFLVSPKRVLPRGVDIHKITVNMIMLIHGDLGVSDETPGVNNAKGVKNGVTDVALRAASIFTDQVLKASIRIANAIAVDPASVLGSGAHSLPTFKPYYAAARDAACRCRQLPEVQKCLAPSSAGADIFCQPYMKCLADKGRADGKSYASTGTWQKFESIPLDSEPVCPGLPPAPRLRPHY